MSIARVLGFVVMAFSLVHCGSEPGGESVVTLESVAALDGDVSGDGVVYSTPDQIKVGEYTNAVGRRGFVSFDLQGQGVKAARLRLYLDNFNSIPYSTLGGVMVDHVDYGATLNAAAYGVSAIATLGKISGSTTDYKHWVELDVTQAVQQAATSGASRIQFRLRHELEFLSTNGAVSYTAWSSGEAAEKPELVLSVGLD